MMEKHEDLIRQLMDDFRLSNETRAAIKALVEERDALLIDINLMRKERMAWKERAEKAEADLAAARACIRDAGSIESGWLIRWPLWRDKHVTAIAAAWAEGGK